MSIQSISVQIFRQACAQDLATWTQSMGWMLSILALNDRLVWLQATKDGRRVEAELRGIPDLPNACGVLMAAVRKAEGRAARAAA